MSFHTIQGFVGFVATSNPNEIIPRLQEFGFGVSRGCHEPQLEPAIGKCFPTDPELRNTQAPDLLNP